MSQAFIREGDAEWLEDVAPTLSALLAYLTRTNNNIRVYEQKNYINPEGKQVYEMSNGLSYYKDSTGTWRVMD